MISNRCLPCARATRPGRFATSRETGRMAVYRWFAVVILVSVAATVMADPVATDRLRYRFLGSANIALPTGYTTSSGLVIADGQNNRLFFSYQVLGKLLEVSTLRALSGPGSNQQQLGFKVNILEEDTWIPNVVFGIGDYSEKSGPWMKYFAASKTIESFSLTLHAGRMRDPITTDQHWYFGFDQAIMPLVTLTGERMFERNTLGVRIHPFPQVTIHAAREGIGSDDQHDIFQASYQVRF